MCWAYGSLAGYGLQTTSAANRAGTNAPHIGGGLGHRGGLTGGAQLCWWPCRMGDAGSTPQRCSVPPDGRMDPPPWYSSVGVEKPVTSAGPHESPSPPQPATASVPGGCILHPTLPERPQALPLLGSLGTDSSPGRWKASPRGSASLPAPPDPQTQSTAEPSRGRGAGGGGGGASISQALRTITSRQRLKLGWGWTGWAGSSPTSIAALLPRAEILSPAAGCPNEHRSAPDPPPSGVAAVPRLAESRRALPAGLGLPNYHGPRKSSLICKLYLSPSAEPVRGEVGAGAEGAPPSGTSVSATAQDRDE